MGALGSVHSHDPAFRTAANVTKQSDRLRRQLLPFAKQNGITSPVAVPDGQRQLHDRPAGRRRDDRRQPAAPLRRARGERLVRHARRPGRRADAGARPRRPPALYAFQRDLEARGIADRVLTLVWSEFGRRAQENGSGGTDHGAAGAAFLIGSRTVGTAVGEFPGLVVARRRRQPEGDLGLPLRLQLAARAVARLRRRAGDPGRREVQALQARQVKTLGALALCARSRSAARRPRPPGCRSSRVSTRTRCRACT